MESKNVWQQILGGNIWGANSFEYKKKIFLGGRGGQNREQFLFKANFLERKFWGPSFAGEILVRRKFRQQNILEEFLYVKFHSEKKYGEKKCLAANSWEEKFGEQILLDEN